MQTEKVIWRNKYTIVVDEQQAYGIHVLKIAGHGIDGTNIHYNKNNKTMQWRHTGQDYSFSRLDIVTLKKMISLCTDERLLDFSNYKCDIGHLWCEYLKQRGCPIGRILAKTLPWPFVPAIIKLLLEEIYDEGLTKE